ncbi:MAG: M23 family metallopeptidase, partial [Bacteroidales bacterium]|nr:M23 family metallopeptidase [Bacteroidales bacterium]
DTVVNYACLDSLYESRIVHETFLKCGMLSIQAAHNRTTIGNISLRMAYLGDSVRRIPSILPIRRFSIASTGASVGKKVNPFLKTVTDHEGIDLLAPIGTDVLATATGVVIAVSNSKSGFGKAVTISHGNGLSTFYCHLNDILVRRGQKITQGDVIGRVGNSGTSFAPHLHYAVFRDGVVQDPVNYFFADLDGKGYREMLLIATNTGQSLD